MDLLKKWLKTPVGLFITIVLGVLIVFILIIKALSGGADSTTVATNMQNQGNSQVQGNKQYTVSETLSTLTGETANIQQGLSSVQKEVDSFKKTQSQKTQAVISHLQDELKIINSQNSQIRLKMLESLKVEKAKLAQMNSAQKRAGTRTDADSGYQVGGVNQGVAQHSIVWLNDQSSVAQDNGQGKKGMHASLGQSLLHPVLSQDSLSNGQKPKPIPAFTIPANTLLTGVTPEQPLVGMIPTDGTVVNPQSVMFMIGLHNLAANNWHLPGELKGIQGNAVCQGVFVWFNDAYANCEIKSLTFIFQDGRIATGTTKGGDEKSFGHLTSLYGSPNIPGTYHGNALYAGIGTGFFSGAQGFGNALANQGAQFTSSGGQTVISYANAFKSSAGGAAGAFGQSMNQWWQQLLKSTTDFVFVPNWNPQTHKILQLNAVINRQVDINYDPNGRKVSYGNFNQNNTSNSLN